MIEKTTISSRLGREPLDSPFLTTFPSMRRSNTVFTYSGETDGLGDLFLGYFASRPPHHYPPFPKRGVGGISPFTCFSIAP